MHILFSYQITESLYESTSSLVCRGLRQTDGKAVVLKYLRAEHPSLETIARFQREFERICKLHRALGSATLANGIIEAYALETFEHRWVMVLEDFGGESLARLQCAGRLNVGDFLKLALAVTEILAKLHRQQVIHKDINPSNIVFNPTSGEVKLIDFGIASELAYEHPTFQNTQGLEGTWAYLSPEQTGRMNRVVDYRTDFYSLGVTFYELLTGQLPFQSQDMLELVHCHIAQQPTPPHALKLEIPLILSQIILKLMAKNAEDRYQSAHGLQADLLTCLHQWQATARIAAFPLAQQDVIDRFQIPQNLYGRAAETQRLLSAFERVSQGVSEMMLVAGYAGIGKSALVQEVYKPITQRHGYFITGKFDQLQRDIPYASLVQAFRSLIRELLTEAEETIAIWRKELLAALGFNAQVIIQVIPEVELIIGPQPAVPDLLPMEAQNRFHLTFQNFIQVFTQPEHPLVIFLDDLQWADGASLKLIQSLMVAGNSRYLLLIGAYRDNEVDAAHPLMLMIDTIKQAGTIVHEIVLAPLDLQHTTQLMMDTFHCSTGTVAQLADLVFFKTNGNPFFLNEFLKALYAEALVTFHHGSNQWQWELPQIQARNITDNVVVLMANKVQKLPQQTLAPLQLAACLGNKFDLATLAVVYGKSSYQTAHDLWNAVVEGLLIPLTDTYQLLAIEGEITELTDGITVSYKFVHDRVQQAVYSLIPTQEKPLIHRQIGLRLLHRAPSVEQDQHIFTITNQLNQGWQLLEHTNERNELAHLNLLAGQKAKRSAAYQPAYTYLKTGLALLTGTGLDESACTRNTRREHWQQQYALSLALYEEAIEAAYLNGDYSSMEQLATIVLDQAATDLDKINVYKVKIQALIAQSKYLESIQTGRQILATLGVTFAEPISPESIFAAIQTIRSTLVGQNLMRLADLPEMTDPTQRAIMEILDNIFVSSFMASPELAPLLVAHAVNLSMQYGNTSESIAAYVSYSMMLSSLLEDYDTSYQLGQLALHLLKQLNAQKLTARTYVLIAGYVRHWKEPLRQTLVCLHEGYQSGLDTGDFTFAVNCLVTHAVFSCLTGRELPEIHQEMVQCRETVIKFNERAGINALNVYHQLVLNLRGLADHPSHLRGQAYDEEQMLPIYLETNDHAALFSLYFIKTLLCYLFHDFQQAVVYSTQAETGKQNQAGSSFAPVANLFDSLARLGVFFESGAIEQAHILNKVAANQEKLKLWAYHAPMNYLHKFYLVEAERARVLGNDSEARDYYDQAIDLAIENEYLNEEALAYELAGCFYLTKGQTRLAHQYLRDAHYAYQRWGAIAKVKDLEQRYPHLLLRSTSSTPRTGLTTTTTSTGQSAAMLDLTSVLKASQAISGEIQLDKLLDKLMKIVIENAGAQRGYLLLERKGQWWIEAEGMIEQGAIADTGMPEVTTQQAIPITTSNRLATTIVNYVTRTKEAVVLDDAAQSSRFTQDPYIRHTQPKSVLCTPLLNQGKLTAILYLENNLTTNAFTQERLEVLNLLSAQAAISLENARLYTHQVALTHGYSRFVPQEILRFLQKESIVDVKLGDQVQQEMAILVSDVRSFTTLSETMTPQENFDFVNAYLGHVSPIVRQHGGLIVKYMGDGMMAVFPTRAEDALRAALDKLCAVERYNNARRAHGYVPLQIGIGIHTGSMMLGTVGEPERMQSDLLSDAVNLTARLEGLAKEYGAALIISQEFLQRLADPTIYQMRFLGKAQVKGRQALVTIYEIFDADPPAQVASKAQTKADFEAALTCFFDQRFAEAYKLFQHVLQHNPQDKAAALYVQRATLALQPPAPLNPVEIASRSEE